MFCLVGVGDPERRHRLNLWIQFTVVSLNTSAVEAVEDADEVGLVVVVDLEAHRLPVVGPHPVPVLATEGGHLPGR